MVEAVTSCAPPVALTNSAGLTPAKSEAVVDGGLPVVGIRRSRRPCRMTIAPVSAAARPPRFPPARGSLAEAWAAARSDTGAPDGALRLFDTVPPGHLVHHASDDGAAPLIRAGEIAVIDPNVCDFFREEGGLYLICWGRRLQEKYGRAQLRFALHEVHRSKHNHEHRYASPTGRARSKEEAVRQALTGRIRLSDGPYSEQAMADVVIGRVVGIYAPSHRGDC